jgi:hypothetical protein
VKLLLRAISLPTDSFEGNLVRLDVGGLTAWASNAADWNQPFTREDLIEHHRIASEIHAGAEACLPVRFPTWFADESELRQSLMSRERDVAGQLERVRGCSEVAVTAEWTMAEEDAAPVEASTPGRQYLLERQRAVAGSERRRARAREIERNILDGVRTQIKDVQTRLCPSPNVALSTALLVARQTAHEVKGRLPRADRDVRILVNGPWPPYSFARVTAD